MTSHERAKAVIETCEESGCILTDDAKVVLIGSMTFMFDDACREAKQEAIEFCARVADQYHDYEQITAVPPHQKIARKLRWHKDAL